jgi:hypothetical protein
MSLIKSFKNFFVQDKDGSIGKISVAMPNEYESIPCFGRSSHSVTCRDNHLPLAFELQCSDNFYSVFFNETDILYVHPPSNHQLRFYFGNDDQTDASLLFLSKIRPIDEQLPVQIAWIKRESYNLSKDVSGYFMVDQLKVILEFSIEVDIRFASERTEKICSALNQLLQHRRLDSIVDDQKSITNLLKNNMFDSSLNVALNQLQDKVKGENNPSILEAPEQHSEFFRTSFQESLSAQFLHTGFQVAIVDRIRITLNHTQQLMDLSVDRQEKLHEKKKLLDKMHAAAKKRSENSGELQQVEDLTGFQSPIRQVVLARLLQLDLITKRKSKSSALTKSKIKRMRWRYRLSEDIDPSPMMDFKRIGVHIVNAIQKIQGVSVYDIEVCAAGSEEWYSIHTSNKEFAVFMSTIKSAARQYQLELPDPEQTMEYRFGEDSVSILTISDIVGLIRMAPDEMHLVRGEDSSDWQPWQEVSIIADQVNS